MTGLSLPADLEPYADSYDQLTNPAVYALQLEKPEDAEWALAGAFDAWPAWGEEFLAFSEILYVGAAKNALERLEQHRDGEFRPTLMEVCEVARIVDLWWFDSAEAAFEKESGIALEVAHEHSAAYVHYR